GTSYYYTTTVHQWYASGSSGFYSAVNSTGNTANRGIGNGNAITVLDNGNYVIGSTTSGGGKGSATFGEGATGVVGTLSSGNSRSHRPCHCRPGCWVGAMRW